MTPPMLRVIYRRLHEHCVLMAHWHCLNAGFGLPAGWTLPEMQAYLGVN